MKQCLAVAWLLALVLSCSGGLKDDEQEVYPGANISPAVLPVISV